MDGVIREVSLANSVSGEVIEGWVGRPWVDTVGNVGGDNILRMVAEATANGVSDFRQISQRFPSGLELPMEYNTVRLGAKSGLIAIGKNLQAIADVQSRLIATQHAREQDAWKLRAVETRFRTLLEASEDPVLLLRMDDLQILDANPAAIHAGAFDAGRDFPAALAARDREAFYAMMARVGEQGRAPGILLHFGSAATPWLVRASVTHGEPQTVFLLQLTPVAPLPAVRRDTSKLEDLIERLPDGFVLVDAAGLVLQANRAFLDLVQAAASGGVVGQPIGRWLTRPGADAAVLLGSVQRHRLVRSFATTLQGDLGTEAKVEISAAGDSEEAPRQIALLVRDVTRRMADAPARDPANATRDERLMIALGQLTEQIGQIPLLDRVNGNRTAAAGLLGLSRQSLYAKLNRYSMGNEEQVGSGD
jgi:transcriptional regulator PpsR